MRALSLRELPTGLSFPLSAELARCSAVCRGSTDSVGERWIEILAEALPPDLQLVCFIAMT